MSLAGVRDNLIADCFGAIPGRKDCCVLVENVCMNQKVCPFYKTKEQYKADRERCDGISSSPRPVTGKRVKCKETGKVYVSAAQVAREYGVSLATIYKAVQRGAKTAGGLTFYYID